MIQIKMDRRSIRNDGKKTRFCVRDPLHKGKYIRVEGTESEVGFLRNAFINPSVDLGQKIPLTWFNDELVEESNYKEDIEEEMNVSEKEDSDWEEEPSKQRLRKRTTKVQYVFENEDSDASDESDIEIQARKRKGKRFNDEEYDPDEDSDHSTKKQKSKRNLTEYETMAQKNRDEKLAFLKTLNFDEIKEGFSDAVKSLKGKRKKRILKPKPPPGPPRKSKRVAGVGIDLSEEALVARSEATAEQKAQTRTKKLPTSLPFERAVLQEAMYSYEDFKKEFGDLDYSPAEPYNEHVSHFENMQLSEPQSYRILPSKAMSLTLHPMKENIVVAAGGNLGHVGFLKVDSDEQYFIFEPHTQAITHLQFNPLNPQLIVSSSRDGTVRCGDLEKAVFHEVYNVSDETSCTYFDFLSHSTLLVAQKNGIVSVVDNREKIRAVSKKHLCYDDLLKARCGGLKTVSVHPLEKSYFLSAGTTGAVKLWDLRKLQKQPITEKQQEKRVYSAIFSPLTGKQVLASGVNSICMFKSLSLEDSLLLPPTLKYSQRYPTWLPNTDDAFVMGGAFRKIEVYNSNMDNIFSFTHEKVGCSVVNMFHPTLPVLVGTKTCTFHSGKVNVFSCEDTS